MKAKDLIQKTRQKKIDPAQKDVSPGAQASADQGSRQQASLKDCGKDPIKADARHKGGEGELREAGERGMWVKCYPDKSTAEKAINNYLRVMAYLNDGNVPRRHLPAEIKITQDTCGFTDSKLEYETMCGYWHHITYCEGGDLVNYASTQHKAGSVMKELHRKAQLVCELAHLLWNWDRAGVYHMDISLTNILVCGTGDEQRLVPTDFGKMAYDGKELMKRDIFGPMNDIEAREGYGVLLLSKEPFLSCLCVPNFLRSDVCGLVPSAPRIASHR